VKPPLWAGGAVAVADAVTEGVAEAFGRAVGVADVADAVTRAEVDAALGATSGAELAGCPDGCGMAETEAARVGAGSTRGGSGEVLGLAGPLFVGRAAAGSEAPGGERK
jgi:hypothetical protein